MMMEHSYSLDPNRVTEPSPSAPDWVMKPSAPDWVSEPAMPLEAIFLPEETLTPEDLQEPKYEPYVKRSLYTGEIARMWNLSKIIKYLGDRMDCLNFAAEQQLIPVHKICPVCKLPMRIFYRSNSTVGTFGCSKGECRKKQPKISRANGTLFAHIKISVPQVFYLMYTFAHKWSIKMVLLEDFTREEEKCLSKTTIVGWNSCLRETIVIYHLEERENELPKIGGPGKTVQIDEAKFNKRNSKKGCHLEGQWILGMIQDGCEDLRLELCPLSPSNVNSSKVLLPLIKKHIAPGTTIRTGCGQAYNCLADESNGYVHNKTINNENNYESKWRTVKKFYYKDRTISKHPYFADKVVEYLWRRNINRAKKDPFLAVINAVRYVYKFNWSK